MNLKELAALIQSAPAAPPEQHDFVARLLACAQPREGGVTEVQAQWVAEQLRRPHQREEEP